MSKKRIYSILLSDVEDSNGNIFNNEWKKDSNGIYRRKKIDKKVKVGFSWQIYNKHECKICKKIFFKENYLKFINKNIFCSWECACSFNSKDKNILTKKELPEFYSLLGWIATDGTIRNNINKNKYEITIELDSQDFDILYKISLIFNGKIHNRKRELYNKNCSHNVWYLSNIDSWKYLNSIGITPAKSLTLNIDNWFNTLTYEQKCCFIRGVIEGDGSIRISQGKYFEVSIISASKSFITTIYNFIKDEILFKKYNIITNNNITFIDNSYIKFNYNILYKFRTRDKIEVQSILKEIYNPSLNNSLYLDRKYNTAMDILNFDNKNYWLNKLKNIIQNKINKIC